MNRRMHFLLAALSLALFTMTLAFCLGQIFARSSPQPVPAPALAASKLSLQTEQENEETVYLLRTVDGEVCILQDGEILLHTGVSAAMLPSQDREALEKGITVKSQADLTSLLEDITS